MMPVWRAALPALVWMTAFLAGCGTTPDSVFYTLRAAEPAPAESSAISVVVGPVTLPETVDRPQLVVSTGGSRVEIAEFHRWAEPLKSEVPRVIASHLGRQLGTTRVGVFTDVSISDPDYRVLVDVQRFELRRSEETVVDALWTVRARAGAARRGHRHRRGVGEPVARGRPAGDRAAHPRLGERLQDRGIPRRVHRDADHRLQDGHPLDLVVVLADDPLLARDVGGGEEREQRVLVAPAVAVGSGAARIGERRRREARLADRPRRPAGSAPLGNTNASAAYATNDRLPSAGPAQNRSSMPKPAAPASIAAASAGVRLVVVVMCSHPLAIRSQPTAFRGRLATR